jgi:hypothetical protein
MFNFNDYFEDQNSGESSATPEKPKTQKKKQSKPVQQEQESFGFDFNAEMIKKEKLQEEEAKRTLEEQKKYEETQRHIQEQNIKKIYKNVGRKGRKTKDPKIKNTKRANKQNLKLKYSDKFLGKVNSYKTRYFANGFSKKLYLEKYKKEQDKLDMEAGCGIDIEELNRQSRIGRSLFNNR